MFQVVPSSGWSFTIRELIGLRRIRPCFLAAVKRYFDPRLSQCDPDRREGNHGTWPYQLEVYGILIEPELCLIPEPKFCSTDSLHTGPNHRTSKVKLHLPRPWYNIWIFLNLIYQYGIGINLIWSGIMVTSPAVRIALCSLSLHFDVALKGV